ncbi:MAG TPA: hypothetical protein VJN21_06870 [Candidatus Acidoferrales bacterium]|nr:hypothetical protein [Candidatus Acidoferrales bacterium]
MNASHCSFETKVAEASRSGVWSDSLREHVGGCRACEDLALVTGYLSAASQTPQDEDALPGVGRIWNRAQAAARAAAMERALRPILWVRRITFAACAAAVIVVAIAWWAQIGGMVSGIAESFTRPTAAAATGQEGALLLIAVAFLVVLVPLIFGLYLSWADS